MSVLEGVTFREASIADAREISELIIASQRKFTFREYTEEGRERMLQLCGGQALEHCISRGDVYFVAEFRAELIGVAGIRKNHHLSHNFVKDTWHRKGVSRQLWKLASARCLANGNPGKFTLQASSYSIPVYKKWGFVATAPASDTGGIVSTPMELHLDQAVTTEC